ncbi:MAG: hypothetical protein EKK61_05710 [Rickettsiales bacterium]|nr:MAG: hypothetical protein EKK61_05710 [Rickettsiales bacterium]
MKQKTLDIFNSFLKLGSTKLVSEELNIPRRSVQHHLKLYREKVLENEMSSNEKIFHKENNKFDRFLDTTSKKKVINYQDTFLRTRNLSISNGYVVVFSDAHYYPGNPIPVAHKALLSVVEMLQPKAIVANGDIFDFNSISRHGKNGWSRTFSLKEELDFGMERLKEIKSVAGSSELLYTAGNHDQLRYDSYLAERAGQFAGLNGFKFEDRLEDWKLSLEILVNKDSPVPTLIKHRTNQGGIHVSYNNAQKAMLSIVTGHSHRLGVRSLSTAIGRYYFGVETGCLMDLDMNAFTDYTEGRSNQKDWLSGFVVLQFKDGNLLHPELCTVINDSAWFRGKKIA